MDCDLISVFKTSSSLIQTRQKQQDQSEDYCSSTDERYQWFGPRGRGRGGEM